MENPDPKKVEPIMDKVLYDIIEAICPKEDSSTYEEYLKLAKKNPITAIKCLCKAANIRREVIASFWLRMQLEGVKKPINCSLSLRRQIQT